MLKLSVWPEKIETGGRGECQYHGFMKLPKNSTFCQKWSQKLPFLLSVSSETGDKKKEPGFHVKTMLGFKKYQIQFCDCNR